MTDHISKVLRAFSSGAFGAIANVILLVIVWEITGKGPGFSKVFLYKQMVWGGIWGFAFMIPFMVNNWWLRGMIWGTAATAVAIFVFGLPMSPPTIIIGLVVNAGAWGLVASWLYQNSGPAPAAESPAAAAET